MNQIDCKVFFSPSSLVIDRILALLKMVASVNVCSQEADRQFPDVYSHSQGYVALEHSFYFHSPMCKVLITFGHLCN